MFRLHFIGVLCPTATALHLLHSYISLLLLEQVNLKPAALAAQQLAARRKAGSAPNYARSSASDVGGGGPASQGAEDGDGTHGTPSVCGMSVRSGEWPTAASMMWEDLMVRIRRHALMQHQRSALYIYSRYVCCFHTAFCLQLVSFGATCAVIWL